jgi:hypothetical protein
MGKQKEEKEKEDQWLNGVYMSHDITPPLRADVLNGQLPALNGMHLDALCGTCL